MNVARRLVAPVAIQDRQNNVTSVDLPSLLARLILFDTCIIQSVWLEDIILLQHSLGVTGMNTLLEAGILGLDCSPFLIAQTGQLNNEPLPPFNYQFSTIRVVDAEQRIERALATLDSGLSAALRKNRVSLPEDFGKRTFETVYRDFATDLLDSAVRMELRRRGIVPSRHDLQTERKGEDHFEVRNDLCRRYLLPLADAHKIIETALMAIARLNSILGTMHALKALIVLRDSDEKILAEKLRSAAFLFLPTPPVVESQFCRVVTLKGLQVPTFGRDVIDVKRLMKIRESDECAAFKDWLSKADGLTNREIEERTTGLARTIRQIASGPTGKAIRFVVSNGVGLLVDPGVVGVAAGLAISALDSFVLDRFITKDSVVSFLSESYPSVFAPSRGRTNP